jgi:uncharacterized protein (TIGR02284 family)
MREKSRTNPWPAICTRESTHDVTQHTHLLEDTMADRNEREALHHLIDICRDGERGYRTAAEHVAHPNLKQLFADLAAQRRQFADELVPHLQRLGGAADGGSNAGTLHRGWMVLKDLVPPHHDHTILAEAERGEHAALDAYENALAGMLPPTVTDLVELQKDLIAKASGRIRDIDMGYE